MASSASARSSACTSKCCDIDAIVTEHGVADLRGLDDTERARRILGVAAPEHRAELEHRLEATEVDT